MSLNPTFLQEHPVLFRFGAEMPAGVKPLAKHLSIIEDARLLDRGQSGSGVFDVPPEIRNSVRRPICCCRSTKYLIRPGGLMAVDPDVPRLCKTACCPTFCVCLNNCLCCLPLLIWHSARCAQCCSCAVRCVDAHSCCWGTCCVHPLTCHCVGWSPASVGGPLLCAQFRIYVVECVLGLVTHCLCECLYSSGGN